MSFIFSAIRLESLFPKRKFPFDVFNTQSSNTHIRIKLFFLPPSLSINKLHIWTSLWLFSTPFHSISIWLLALIVGRWPNWCYVRGRECFQSFFLCTVSGFVSHLLYFTLFFFFLVNAIQVQEIPRESRSMK